MILEKVGSEKKFKIFLSLNFEVKSVFTFLSHSELPLSNDKVLEKIALGQIFCENLRRERKRVQNNETF